MSVEKINDEAESSNEKSELLDQDSQFKYAKDYEELKPGEKANVIKGMRQSRPSMEDLPSRDALPQEAYLKTNDKKELFQLAKATGTMEQVSGKRWENSPFLLWESYQAGQYADSHIIILDKDVSRKLLYKQMVKDINRRRKDYQVVSSYIEAQEAAFEELWNQIHEYSLTKKGSKSIIQRYMEQIGEKAINESTVEMKEVGFIASNKFKTIVFANDKKTIFKQIDARYYAGLTKEWQNPTFYTKGQDNKESNFLVLRAENEAKAIVLPIISFSNNPDPAYTKLVQEVKSEVRNAEDRI